MCVNSGATAALRLHSVILALAARALGKVLLQSIFKDLEVSTTKEPQRSGVEDGWGILNPPLQLHFLHSPCKTQVAPRPPSQPSTDLPGLLCGAHCQSLERLCSPHPTTSHAGRPQGEGEWERAVCFCVCVSELLYM